jgi:hypothetical protein
VGDEQRERTRFGTRTWRPGSTPEPVGQVADPAMRAILLIRRRALLMEVREIERRCGLGPDTPDDEAA